ncbi:hypothetical protein [Anaerosporobacter sp.]
MGIKTKEVPIDTDILNKITSMKEVEKIQQIPYIRSRRISANQREYNNSVSFFAYEPEIQRYQFFDDKGSDIVPSQGEIYLPKAMDIL